MLPTIINTGRMFIIRQEGLDSFVSYRIRNQEIDIYNAFVPKEHRGRGYASQLILHGIHFAVLHGFRVKASCPAAIAYVRRNPEWHYTVSELEKVKV